MSEGRWKHPEPMVDLPTAAAHFALSVDTLRDYVTRGKIRHYRLGVKLLRVRLTEVEEDLCNTRVRGRPRSPVLSAREKRVAALTSVEGGGT